MSATPHDWPANAEPTPEQLAAWLTRCTDDERTHVARVSITNARQAAVCFRGDHESQIEALTAEVQRLRGEPAEAELRARVEALADKWERGYRSPTASNWSAVHAEQLRSVLDGGK